MGRQKGFEHHDLSALRVGRFSGRANTSVLVYALGDVLIDSGAPNRAAQVREFAAQRRARRVLLTHHHEDHSGGAAALAAAGLSVFAPDASLGPLAAGWRLRPYQRLIWGRPLPPAASPLPSSIELAGGLCLLAVPAPGHSPDMTCFLLPERGWLFTGDAVVTLRPRYLRGGEDVGEHIASLRRLLALDWDSAFCAHLGRLVHGKADLVRRLDYLEGLVQRAGELRTAGLNPHEITRRLLGREGGLTWLTGGDFSKAGLVRSCLAAAVPPAEPSQ